MHPLAPARSHASIEHGTALAYLSRVHALSFSIWPRRSELAPNEEWRAKANATAVAYHTTWSEFAAWLCAPLDSDDKHEQAFSPLSAIAPGKHGRVHGGPAGFLALEYDEGATPAVLARAVDVLAPFDAIVYTSANATPSSPRFRVVLRVSRPIATDAEYRSCVDHFGQLVGTAPASESRQRTRVWFRPIARCSTRALFGGAPWDVDASVLACPPAPVVERPPVDVSAFASDARWQQAWVTLDRRRPEGAFATALICRDHALEPEAALAMVTAYATAVGWEFEDDELAARVEHAYEYAREEPGNALVPTVVQTPDMPARIETGDTSSLSAGFYVQNDSGNSERLVDLFGGNLRFCEGLGWLRWDGKRWAASDAPWVEAGLCAKLLQQEGARVGGEVGDAMRKWGIKSGNAKEIGNCLRIAEHHGGTRLRADQIDSDPWLFNTINGTVDLRTGTLREHRRDDLITKLAPIAFDASATCPRFDAFLVETMDGDHELGGYLRRWLGYCLTGITREHTFTLWYGPSGRNGKSVLLNTMLHVLGDYAGTVPPGLLLLQKHEQHPTALLSLRGLRFAATNEVPEGQRFNESLIKQLTGGDKISARAMRQDFIEFAPSHKITLAANARPVVRESGPAFWSRCHTVPWLVSFEGREDRQLEERLRAEAPGILALLVRGCLEWQVYGLRPPKRIQDANADYRASQDTIALFAAECLVSEPNAWVPRTELYAAYADWCRSGGEYALSASVLYRVLEERCWPSTKRRGIRGFSGVRIQSPLERMKGEMAAN